MIEIPHLFISFLGASLLVNLIPGSDRVYVVATSLRHGLKGAWLASLGISTGIFIHSLIGAFGFGALIQNDPLIFNWIRLAGIALLFFLGLHYWFRNPIPLSGLAKFENQNNSYWQGLFVHLLNPVAIIFSFTFIPEFIDPDGNFTGQFLLLSATANLISLIINYAAAAAVHFVQKQFSMGENRVRILSGLILIGLSIYISLTWILGN